MAIRTIEATAANCHLRASLKARPESLPVQLQEPTSRSRWSLIPRPTDPEPIMSVPGVSQETVPAMSRDNPGLSHAGGKGRKRAIN